MDNSGHDLPDKPAAGAPAHVVFGEREVSLDRIRDLVADLERELARADIPQAHDIRKEIDTLKQMLEAPDRKEGWIQERLHAIRDGLQDMSARVEGEVLRDSPYIAEIGRILGLV